MSLAQQFSQLMKRPDPVSGRAGQLLLKRWGEKIGVTPADVCNRIDVETVDQHATLPLVGTVDAGFPSGTPTMAHVTFAPQTLNFFAAGTAGQINDGLGAMRAPDELDTSLTDARKVSGNRDMAISGVQMRPVGLRVKWPSGAYAGVTDATLVGAYTGEIPIYDPGLHMSPAQASSPFNLEAGIWETARALALADFEWVAGDTRLGTAEAIGGGEGSTLRGGGEAEYGIREGIVWAHGSSPAASDGDSDLIFRWRLLRAFVVPITVPYTLGASSGTRVVPERIVLDLRVKLKGMTVGTRSKN